MIFMPNGSIVSIATGYTTVRGMSGITNATEAVATLVANHDVQANDIIEVQSAWAKLNSRIVQVKSVASDEVTLKSVDTSNLQQYPVGAGVGGVRVVSGWTQISQILESSAAGGEQMFYNYQFLEDTTDERQLPTIRSARSISFTIADDPSLPHNAILDAADQDRLPRALRLAMPSGAVIYYNGYVSFSKTPTLSKNEAMALNVTFSLSSEPTRY